jgi:beta-N-acetylhexosaminidase
MPKLWIRTGGLDIAAVIALAFATTARAGRTASPSRARPGTAAQAGQPGGQAGLAGSPAAASSPSGAAGAPAAPAATLPKLTDRQLAGQRIIYSYSGLTPPASLLWLIRHGEAAGVIFFGQNISSRAQIRSAIRQLELADASTLNPVRTPLLLMTDQEGGEVRRLSGQPVLSEKQIGEAANRLTEATDAGTGAGKNLRGVGMNVNLAPVLDVFRHPGDFDDQFQRSYSRNPHVVSELGANFITAQQKAGVAATAKHFPGLGSASRTQDTDVEPVTIRLSARALRDDDELPYKAAISAGVKLVMVSWALYPSLDPKYPAGLSSTIVQGELRQRLGFTGVTITDALEAGALKAFGTYKNRAELAAAAGMDLILAAGQNVPEGVQAMDGLEAGYRSGTLGHPAFQASVQRVLALRASLHG